MDSVKSLKFKHKLKWPLHTYAQLYISLASCIYFQERLIIDSKYCTNDGGHSEIVTALDSAFWVKYSQDGEREVLAEYDEESDIFINVGNCMGDDNEDMHAVSGKYN